MRRSLPDNLLFALAVVFAFGASSYFWFNFFVRGKSIPTPNLIGRSINDARAICSDLGIVLLVDPAAARHADRVVAGAVVWQNRTAGAANFVKRGTRLRVGISLGPLVLHVPDLTATSARTALLRLGQQALRLGEPADRDEGAPPAETRRTRAPNPTPAALEPGPLVTRVRSLTVANVDSIGFVVRRWIQCSAG